MKLPVVLGHAARKEFDEAADWYNKQQPGLGDDFIDHVKKLINDIGDRATSFPVAQGPARKAVMPKPYPYTLYFKIEPTRVVVASVFHQRRDPTVWQSRI